jgi:Xaa-Pro aminopeptidase
LRSDRRSNAWLIRLLCGALFLALAASARAASASEFSDDLSQRRARVMDRLGPDSLLVLWSAPARRYSLDVDYEYRQDSNLYYLTGLTQEGTILVLMPGSSPHREFLFIKDKDVTQEHWHGRTLTTEEARARTGIATVLLVSQFESFVTNLFNRQEAPGVTAEEAGRFFEALAANRARLSLVYDGSNAESDPASASAQFAARMRSRFSGFTIANVASVFDDLRTVKTPYERTVLVRSLQISSDAQLAGMRVARPGAYEYEVKAAIEAVHRSRGAVSWSYPSIVGSGPNATILHYPDGDRQMQAGDLLLVDAACNFGYMSGDITRTYPVSGRFSAAQKDIYRIVLQAQEQGLAAAQRPGASLQDIHTATVEVIKGGLLKLGLITDPQGEQYRLWYTHGASHYIGIDVHDVGSRMRPIQAGMAFTIEPGLYIRQSALDTLPRTVENLAFIEQVQAAVRRYADIGVRIEDSFLADDRGIVNLSASVPKTIEAVEAFLRTGRREKKHP